MPIPQAVASTTRSMTRNPGCPMASLPTSSATLVQPNASPDPRDLHNGRCPNLCLFYCATDASGDLVIRGPPPIARASETAPNPDPLPLPRRLRFHLTN